MKSLSDVSLFDSLSLRVLNALVDVWPNPMDARNKRMQGTLGSVQFAKAYGEDQFMKRATAALGLHFPLPPLWGKDILELGCGHGGISCFLASLGARKVVGIDVNTEHLKIAAELADDIAHKSGHQRLPVQFIEMNCHALSLQNESFDCVMADNLLEHVDDPRVVLTEAWRVLRPGGIVIVPNFSSIYSKYGLHLKNGIKLPWVNLVFSEEVIVKALARQTIKRPELLSIYPGAPNHPKHVRDVRAHHDLNTITYRQFHTLVRDIGFEMDYFAIHANLTGRVLRKLSPRLMQRTMLGEILSTGAAAVLRKKV